MSAFTRVGREIPFGVVEASLQSVEPIRDLATRELPDASRAPRARTVNDREVLSYSFLFEPHDWFEERAQTRFVSVRYMEDLILPSWRLAISIRNFTELNRYYTKRAVYSFETLGDELLEAKKALYFSIGTGRIVMGSLGEPVEEVRSVRKVHEKIFLDDESSDLLTLLHSTVKRARVLGVRR